MGDRVSISILHGTYDPPTVGALAALVNYDLRRGGRHLDHDDFFIQVGTTNIAQGRNEAVKAFLATQADWLLFLDSDEVWRPDLIERLIESADVEERPIISGLIMARRERDMPLSPACAIFDDHPAGPRLVRPQSIPNVRWWQVGTVGAGCLLIHRRVLEDMRAMWAEKYPASIWFDYQDFTYHKNDELGEVTEKMGEDYVFSARAMACGYAMLVDTTIELGHIKEVTLTREMFHTQMAQRGERPTFVVVPIKDKLELTEALVEQLRSQGGYDGIFIYDNGSGAATKEWLRKQYDLLVWDAKGRGIHEMWNAGVEEAIRRSGGRCDIVFLNNDLKLGDRFVGRLRDGLRSGPWVAVSGNYDGRDATEQVVPVRGICAERYDGTGGLAGFAFAVRSEWFTNGYRFPTDMRWWFGDSDMVLTMDTVGAPYGIVTDATVEHIGAGTAGDWQSKKWQPQLLEDQAAFDAKWGKFVGKAS